MVFVQIALWHWLAFGGLVAVLLALDLFVFHRHSHAPSIWESTGWTVFWIALAFAFNGLIWWWLGSSAAILFLTGYVVEKSLSVDNIFVFLVIFRFFQVPLQHQYRVLFWGVLGAVFMRLAFILAGTELLHRFEWMVCVFGAFLIYTAIKLALHASSDVDPEHNLLLRVARRWLPVSKGNIWEHEDHFVVRQEGRLHLTPLLLVLLVIESTDVLFAVDSVPAIIAITRDPFLVFTSNIFAILGLRALYFVVAGAMDMFAYLHYGLSAVLGFVGLKMIGEYVVKLQAANPKAGDLVPPWASLLVIVLILAVSILASMVTKRREEAKAAPDEPPSNSPA